MRSVIKQKNPEWLYVYYVKQISGQEVWLEMKKIKEVILGRLAAPNPRTSQKLEAAVRRQPVYRPSKGFGYTLLANR